ncbi:PQQ-binding-like beta-propeller repeat protein, partial [Candidatus Sumerlaeota bacterium]|nr:PQQ-binding-like beta-propeller repeat protein [Candidatus Sumerlaeota bacterium]
GKILWKKESTVVSMSLAADAKRVLFHDGQKIVCLDRGNGQIMWSSEPLARREGMRSSGGVTLVVYDDVVLYDGQAPANAERRTTAMVALSAKDGKTLWKAEHPPCGHAGTPNDILVVGGLVWTGAVALGTDSGVMTGRDLKTGEVKKEIPPDVQTHWFHHRCYRAKATDNYLLFSRTGIEFIDVATNRWTCHHWTRGGCLYGVMPANGLIYNPPHPCACYLEAKLFGFHALAPALKTPLAPLSDDARLERGPAHSEVKSQKLKVKSPSAEEWPTYRHDASRSGSTKSSVPTDLKQLWQADVGGKLSSPVIADGKLFVASVDAHTVYALDANTGKVVWIFIAGGRVDSPPTIWQGRVLFGSADGNVYCLSASDGRLVWRFQAAPEQRRMGAFEQVESVWPVHGSVLVQNDTVYCVAGRSMFLDGGLRLLRLDPTTGRKLSETILDDRDPATGDNLQVRISGLNMPVALPDILSSDGRYVYMRSLPFDLQGQRKIVDYVPVKDREGDDIHLFSPTGFLDSTMWHRTYWAYGRAFASGAGGYYQEGRVAPSGRLLVFDDDTVYGYGRYWQYYRWTTPLEFHLFAAPKKPDVITMGMEAKSGAKKQAAKKGGNLSQTPVTRFSYEWSDEMSEQVVAMVKTGNALFAAGPPDVVDEEAAVKSLDDPETQKKLAEQKAAFEGRKGALLVAVSPADGK